MGLDMVLDASSKLDAASHCSILRVFGLRRKLRCEIRRRIPA